MHRYRRARLALALLLLLTAACSPHYPAGPKGKVTDRSATYRKADGWRYSLTVRGRTFRVTGDDYRNCFHDSWYPGCAPSQKK
jgi:hypothetical protein